MKKNRPAACIVCLALALATGLPAHPPAAEAEPGLGQLFRRGGFDTRAEEELARLMNESRRQAGVEPLAQDERLREAARRHTTEMMRQGVLSHDLPGHPGLRERLAQTDVRVDAIAENVAQNADAASAHAGLMASEGHRRNILDPRYNAIGIGAVRHNGSIYVTQVFAHRLPVLAPEEAETMVAESFNQARRDSGHQPLRHVLSERLRLMACAMAERDQLDTGALRTDPGMSSVVAYTIIEPERLPPQAQRRAAEPGLDAMAVGACFARSPKYPTGIHWVIIGFYE